MITIKFRLRDLTVPATVLQGHYGKVIGVAFSPDGRTPASGGGNKGVLLSDLTNPLNTAPRKDIVDLICETAWRNLTLTEWREFVSSEMPYERTCPNLPAHPTAIIKEGM